jgi:hypothetical protein
MKKREVKYVWVMVYRDHQDGDPSISAYSTEKKLDKALLDVLGEFVGEISPDFNRAVTNGSRDKALRLWVEHQDSKGFDADYIDLRKCELDI